MFLTVQTAVTREENICIYKRAPTRRNEKVHEERRRREKMSSEIFGGEA